MAVDQKNIERLADRHDQPAVVVELERIIVDRNLDQMVARRGELLAEDGRDVFAGRKIERLFESQDRRRPSAARGHRRRGRRRSCASWRGSRRRTHRHDGDVQLQVGDRAVFAARLSQVDHHRPRPPGLELGHVRA